jgi:hypothetical protein
LFILSPGFFGWMVPVTAQPPPAAARPCGGLFAVHVSFHVRALKNDCGNILLP